ncbi:hypothetical protein SARC_15224, partial [Sphaeroforma arctica JP610]
MNMWVIGNTKRYKRKAKVRTRTATIPHVASHVHSTDGASAVSRRVKHDTQASSVNDNEPVCDTNGHGGDRGKGHGINDKGKVYDSQVHGIFETQQAVSPGMTKAVSLKKELLHIQSERVLSPGADVMRRRQPINSSQSDHLSASGAHRPNSNPSLSPNLLMRSTQSDSAEFNQSDAFRSLGQANGVNGMHLSNGPISDSCNDPNQSDGANDLTISTGVNGLHQSDRPISSHQTNGHKEPRDVHKLSTQSPNGCDRADESCLATISCAAASAEERRSVTLIANGTVAHLEET